MTASVRPDRPRETGVGVGRLGQREPAARWLRVVLGWSVAAVGLLAAVGCRLQLPAAPTEPWTIPVHPITYTGVVFEPHSRATGRYGSTGDPIPGARVTIVGGQPDGWTTLTDAEGRFAFEDYLYCELKSAECLSRRFRVEKAGYETRDVGASDPDYSNGSPRYSASDKRIAMGHVWPTDPETRRMRRDLPAMHPLWLLERPDLTYGAGAYASGVLLVDSLENLTTIGHEYCHAHQDWTIDPTDYSGYSGWLQTPSGHAFLAAWEADWPHPYLGWVEINGSRASIKAPQEEAAVICSHYFYEDFSHWFMGTTVTRRYLRDHVPHVHAWAEEWLRHR